MSNDLMQPSPDVNSFQLLCGLSSDNRPQIINIMSLYFKNIIPLVLSALLMPHTQGTELSLELKNNEITERHTNPYHQSNPNTTNPFKSLTQDLSIDLSWVKSVDVWYAPLIHKFYAKNCLKFWGFSDENEATYKENLCLAVNSLGKGDVILWRAYGKYCLPQEINFNPTRPGILNFDLVNGEFGATAYFVLTDNQTYFLPVAQHVNGQQLFMVFSTQQVLSAQILKEITDKLHSMGFTKDTFVTLNYGNCAPYKECRSPSL